MIKRLSVAAIATMTFASAGSAVAGGPVVVELFTSQGCSSCPPADALLGELADREDVIALSLHVDYWDYLGWEDQFGSKANADRQRGYAHASNSTMIYTPQMVIAGTDELVGTKAMKLAQLIDRHKAKPDNVTLTVTRTDAGKLRIAAKRLGDVPGKMLVQIVRYVPEQLVEIRSGENAGMDVTYHNIVESLEPIGDWTGDADLNIQTEVSGDNPVVVLIQDGSSGPILAAARAD
ncbi:DUF1223 domain-containing protein [Litoreibacter albidus]|uniref:DUF1223 domain-containing protein n=1 Tax=Litoreibacter albidus TaxID=670155 RepID=A0A1H2YB91_9RHOB|nr:DUF1223 domain-containing protein [Litoreibacter albidus]SDX01819.1 hypothetical protein SAMN04488001_2262 [Litoreibacter albidus]